MKVRVLGLVAVVLCALVVRGQTREGAGILVGSDYAFSIIAPPGWVLDGAAGKKQGLCAVVYEDGRSWKDASIVMYANTASKKVEGQETLQELMAFDVADFKKHSSRLSVMPVDDIKTGTGVAVVRLFEGDQFGNFEAIAYIDEKFTIVMLVLSARSKEEFESAYPAFQQLVRSYHFLTSNVKIEKPTPPLR
jgi:hypothetical protein